MDKNTILSLVFMLGQYFVISLLITVIIVYGFEIYVYLKNYRKKIK